MKIAIYGAGGVGGYFGGRLAQTGADVHLIARGEHLEVLRQRGLRVDSVFGDFQVDVPATDDPADIGPCDYVLFCVKAYDTDEAARDLHPLVHEETAVISLQNGVDNEEKLGREIGEEHVLGGLTYVLSYIAEPGTIEHNGGPTTVTFGELDGSRSDRAERFLEACEQAGIDATLSEDVLSDSWQKFAAICAYSGLTAATRLPIGEIRSTPETWKMYRRIIEEVSAVGKAEGIDLPEDLADYVLEAVEGLHPDASSSLYHDLIHDNPMELETLHGEVVRRASEHGIDVSMNEAIYAFLRPWVVRNQRGPQASG